jgi:hypothetical protein
MGMGWAPEVRKGVAPLLDGARPGLRGDSGADSVRGGCVGTVMAGRNRILASIRRPAAAVPLHTGVCPQVPARQAADEAVARLA